MNDKKTERINVRCSKNLFRKLSVMSEVDRKNKTTIIEESINDMYKKRQTIYDEKYWEMCSREKYK